MSSATTSRKKTAASVVGLENPNPELAFVPAAAAFWRRKVIQPEGKCHWKKLQADSGVSCEDAQPQTMADANGEEVPDEVGAPSLRLRRRALWRAHIRDVS